VAGISFKDNDGVQILKDYMASGSFARGRDAVNAYASMVFVRLLPTNKKLILCVLCVPAVNIIYQNLAPFASLRENSFLR